MMMRTQPFYTIFTYIKRTLILILFFTYAVQGYGQDKSKTELKKEKKKHLKEIKENQRILEETKSKKTATIGQLSALKQQIKARKAFINSMHEELQVLNKEIRELNMIISSMEKDLKNLKKEYAQMVYESSKANTSYEKIVYLFSAQSLNELRMRLHYLEEYTEAREKQVEQIKKVKQQLQKQYDEFKAKQQRKQNLLDTKSAENSNLIALTKQKDQLVKKLKTREEELRQEIKQHRKEVEHLEELIEKAIKREMRKKNRKTASGKIIPREDLEVVSSSFEANKGRMLWPVNQGFISKQFGKQAHPVLDGVTTENLGVNIQTNQGAKVRTVFEGVVSRVTSVPGMNKMIMVQHGDFFTVYTRIDEVLVKSGEEVTAKQPIGKVYTNKEGVTEFQFQIWKNRKRLDPEDWLN